MASHLEQPLALDPVLGQLESAVVGEPSPAEVRLRCLEIAVKAGGDCLPMHVSTLIGQAGMLASFVLGATDVSA